MSPCALMPRRWKTADSAIFCHCSQSSYWRGEDLEANLGSAVLSVRPLKTHVGSTLSVQSPTSLPSWILTLKISSLTTGLKFPWLLVPAFGSRPNATLPSQATRTMPRGVALQPTKSNARTAKEIKEPEDVRQLDQLPRLNHPRGAARAPLEIAVLQQLDQPPRLNRPHPQGATWLERPWKIVAWHARWPGLFKHKENAFGWGATGFPYPIHCQILLSNCQKFDFSEAGAKFLTPGTSHGSKIPH